jgi:hypothetical protein
VDRNRPAALAPEQARPSPDRRDEAVPINSAEASAQLDIELAKQGLERFADTKTARRHAELAADAQSVNSDPPA